MRTLIVTFREEYHHLWPEAPEEHFYLSALHRHMLHFRVEFEVVGDDREMEFIEVGRDLNRAFNSLSAGALQVEELGTGVFQEEEVARFMEMQTLTCFGAASCEAIAEAMTMLTLVRCPATNFIKVEVLEDGENGASFTWQADPWVEHERETTSLHGKALIEYVLNKYDWSVLEQTDFCNPILVSSEGVVLDGAHRIVAARAFGRDVPCIRLPFPVEMVDPNTLVVWLDKLAELREKKNEHTRD